MRTLMVCLMLLLPCIQVAAAAPAPGAEPIVPVLALTITPPIINLTVTPEAPGIAMFEGTATVDKLPVVRCVVSLSSSTDSGWVSQISPTDMVFTSEAPQPYTVTVVVPQGTPTSQGKLVVYGRAVTAGLQSTAEITAILDVKGTTAVNLTAQNRTASNTTQAAATPGGGPNNLPVYSMVAMVLIAVPTGGYLYYRRRTRRSPGPEA